MSIFCFQNKDLTNENVQSKQKRFYFLTEIRILLPGEKETENCARDP